MKMCVSFAGVFLGLFCLFLIGLTLHYAELD